MSCTCPHVMIGSEKTGITSWHDTCPEHGVGTAYFRSLKPLPYGYAAERDTTRDEWLAFLASESRPPG